MSPFAHLGLSTPRMRSRIAEVALLALVGIGLACATPGPGSGTVLGRLVGNDSAPLPRLVYLEGQEGTGSKLPARPTATELVLSRLFDERLALVRAGRTMRIENDTPVIHQVFSRSTHNAIELDPLASGAAKRIRAPEVGEIRLYCALHPWEDATLVSVPSPWGALVDAHGAFRIHEVDEGDYRLIVWDRGQVRASARIRVMEGATVSVDLPIAAERGSRH
jgi:hypothetical protein